MWTLVASTPTTRLMASTVNWSASGGRRQPRPHALERLVDELSRGALDHSRADAGEGPEDLDRRLVVHGRRPLGRAGQAHPAVRLDLVAGRRTGGADHRAVGLLGLDELQVDREPER